MAKPRNRREKKKEIVKAWIKTFPHKPTYLRDANGTYLMGDYYTPMLFSVESFIELLEFYESNLKKKTKEVQNG